MRRYSLSMERCTESETCWSIWMYNPEEMTTNKLAEYTSYVELRDAAIADYGITLHAIPSKATVGYHTLTFFIVPIIVDKLPVSTDIPLETSFSSSLSHDTLVEIKKEIRIPRKESN